MALSCFGAGMGLLTILYIFDVSYWDEHWNGVKHMSYALVGAGVTVGILLSTKTYPSAPLALFLAFLGLAVWYSKSVFFADVHISTFFSTLAVTLNLTSAAVLIAWIANYQHWNDELELEYAMHLGCNLHKPAFGTNTTAEVVAEVVAEVTGRPVNCRASFILWLAPFVLCVVLSTFGCVMYVSRIYYL
jgi:hypothetical protein